MAHIKLHSSHLAHNLDLLADRAGGRERIIAVLKDNAYGHGLEIFAREVSRLGITHAITRDYDEALGVAGYFEDVIALSQMGEFVPHPKIIYAINDMAQIACAPRGCRVALKIDSGMHRNGIAPDEIENAMGLISSGGLKLHSIFTHFRAADEIGADFYWQRESWRTIKLRCQDLAPRFGFDELKFHSHNSAALLRTHEFDEDFARVGIAMYGYCDLPKSFGDFDLRPVLELCARRVSTRRLIKGDRVGYGGVYETAGGEVASVYDAGYADGVMRYDGKSDLATADGERLLGRVSMDSLSVESERPEISLIRDAEAWAKRFGTISYDILVKLNPKIPREFV
jgi:alanine racemase